MKKAFLLLLTLIYFVTYSQQNFINVPSSEATQRHKLFFQQQINFNEVIQSNTTIDLGLGKGFEAGVNVLGLNFSDKNKSFIRNDTNDKDPYNPLVMLNALKQFRLNDHVFFSTGAQTGLNFRDGKRTTGAGLVYGNISVKDFMIKNSNLVLGAYYNSIHYGGRTGNRFGGWIGTEVPLNEHFHIMAESIIGTNALCYTSVGMIVYPIKWMPITFGIQVPNTKNNAYSLVFELTVLPHQRKVVN